MRLNAFVHNVGGVYALQIIDAKLVHSLNVSSPIEIMPSPKSATCKLVHRWNAP